ncbi:MAG: ATP-dependent protease, partial [archaeon GBS-70-058]|nr:ATP-dependent protease [Candidatus Culexarchaeum nevadense]
NPDGSVGSVGGVLEKAIAAAKSGCKLFLVPKGQSNIPILKPIEKTIGNVKIITYQYTIINLESHLKNYGFQVKVVEVENINDVARYMLGEKT